MGRKVWVVEMLTQDRGSWREAGPQRWEPTIGCGLTRNGARDVLAKWCASNPHDRFRLVAYVPATKARRGR